MVPPYVRLNKAEIHQIRFPLPNAVLGNIWHTDLLTVFKGFNTSKETEGKGEKRGEERGGKGRGGAGRDLVHPKIVGVAPL